MAVTSQPSTAVSAGAVKAGATVSSTVINWVLTVSFKQGSVALNVRVTVVGQVPIPTRTSANLKPHASEALPPAATSCCTVIVTAVSLYARPVIAVTSQPSTAVSSGAVKAGAT